MLREEEEEEEEEVVFGPVTCQVTMLLCCASFLVPFISPAGIHLWAARRLIVSQICVSLSAALMAAKDVSTVTRRIFVCWGWVVRPFGRASDASFLFPTHQTCVCVRASERASVCVSQRQ